MQSYILAAILLLPLPSIGAEVLKGHVSEKDGLFSIQLEMQIEGDEDDVYDLLTNYNQLTKLSDVIISSKVIKKTALHSFLILKSEGCVLFFCTNITQTQKITERDDGYIDVEDIKGKSDFTYGQSLWYIRAGEEGTLISYNAQLKPGFWLPPLIGNLIFKRRLLEESRNMVIRIEQLATNEE